MAATGFTPIQLYRTSTASAVPSAGNLAEGELAINITDKKLYAKDNVGSVFLLASADGTTGTVSTVSVVSANGFAGSVANATTTPAITLTTSISGVLKGNGTAISAATAGTDYLAPPSGTSILKANSGGALANAVAGTDYLAPPSGTALLKANSGGALANATAGTDYVAPGTATTFTALQTFSGSSSVLAAKLANAKEDCTVSATSATGTINYDVTTQSVLYYTSNASGNFTINLQGSAGSSLDSMMSTGESVTVAFLNTNGGTAYYQTGFQVDGSSVTPKWQGGSAPSSGNSSSIDIYTITVIKTGAGTFTALESQVRFA